MTNMLKVFRADVHSILRTLGERSCYRVTGDCTPRYHDEEK